MKDLYSFDKSIETAMDTYQAVSAAYHDLLVNQLGLPVVRGETTPTSTSMASYPAQCRPTLVISEAPCHMSIT